MDQIICPGCQLSIVPIKLFERSPKSAQWWRITKCPRERCGFNIDIEKCDNPSRNTKSKDDDRRRSFWRDEL